MSETIRDMSRIFDEAIRLASEKNAKYGDAWQDQGWRGNLSRILEKDKRLRTMLWRAGEPFLNGEKEHPRETAMDMMNTLAFLILNMDADREWGHEDVGHIEQQSVYAGGLIDPVRVDNWQPQPYDQLPEDAAEQTGVMQAVGDLGTPGEEAPDKPTPRPRGRKVRDNPQA